MDWFSQLISTLKLFISARIIFGILITSGFLLFFGKYFPFLEEIINTNKALIFIVFILTAAILIFDIVSSVINYISKIIKPNTLKRWILKRRIKSLNDSEKAILREFFIQGKEDIKLPINNPNVAGLIEKGILYIIVGYSVKHLPVGVIAYVGISYGARELLNLELIGWPESRPQKRELKRILENRPQFIKVIEAERDPFKEWLK